MNRHQRRANAKLHRTTGAARAAEFVQSGVGHHQAGRLLEAEACYRQALAVQPDQVDALHLLGLIAHQNKRHDVAAELLRLALRHGGNNAVCLSNLGAVLREQGNAEEALTVLREAIRLKPDSGEAHCNLGVALRDLGRLDEAVAAYRHAIALKPDYDIAYGNLGAVLIQLGQPDEARVVLEQAVKLAPLNVTHHRYLAEVEKFSAGSARLDALEDLARNIDKLSPQGRIDLHFSLGKAYDDMGRPADAFRHFLQGNSLKRRDIAYDEAAALEGFRRIQSTFTPDFIRARRDFGIASALPVFIIGMPRSGTTLVEQILASHPDVHGAGEVKFFGQILDAVLALQGASDGYPELLPGLSEDDFREIGTRYLEKISALAPAARRIVNKTTTNFRMLGAIHLALPAAAVIHVVRNPLDTCLSCFSKQFVDAHSYSYDLTELGHYYAFYRELMVHWACILPPARILDVSYESLVADVETEARRIVAHCGLDWDPRCLEFHKTERPVLTASALQVRQPIYDRSVGRWRAYGALLEPLMKALGAEGDPIVLAAH